MRIRHRIPSIFNLSMVDVLCCALGCVILLWLFNLREATQRAKQAEQAQKQLAQLHTGYTALLQERDEAKKQLTDLQQRMSAAAAELLRLTSQLATSKREHDQTRDSLSALEKILDKVRADYDLARKQATTLTTQLRDQEARTAAQLSRADELVKKLDAAEAQVKQVQTVADTVPDLRAQVMSYREKLAAETALTQKLQKEIGDRSRQLATADDQVQTLTRSLAERQRELDKSQQAVASAQEEKRTLRNEMNQVRAAVANRFAGITLTGRRVIFLVDMSGSMELVDEKTSAPTKWAEVGQTLVQIMRSLPDLEKFQVLLFSEKVSYLLGQQGRWFDYDKTSSERVQRALAVIKPIGGTNMYSAFAEAFHFRSLGLDTIYVFSDGLPNMGVPLSAEAERTMKETDKAEILSREIRKTLLRDWNRSLEGRARVRINAIGFFFESPDVGAFLWALTRENEGSFVGMSRP